MASLPGVGVREAGDGDGTQLSKSQASVFGLGTSRGSAHCTPIYSVREWTCSKNIQLWGETGKTTALQGAFPGHLD